MVPKVVKKQFQTKMPKIVKQVKNFHHLCRKPGLVMEELRKGQETGCERKHFSKNYFRFSVR
jgi:hypothetical protein